MSVPLPGLTLKTSLYTCIYSQVHICCITNTFVYEPMLCNLTYVCALAGAHTQNPFVCIHIFTGIHACIYYWYSCIWTDVVQTYICLCPCECSHLEPLVCIHIVTSIQILLYIINTLVNEPKLRNSNLFVPLQVLTLRTSLFTYSYTHKYTLSV